EVLLATVLDPPRRTERIELHRGVAARRDVAGPFRKRVRGSVSAVPAVGVDTDAVANATAQQLMDRLAGRLADDVPAGNLDRRDCRHVDLAAVGVDVASHLLVEQLDLAGVQADLRV